MHQEILTKKQKELLPLIKSFSEEFGLVGGTAIALQLGHRESIDFDLFKKGTFDVLKIKKSINKHFPIDRVLVENSDEYTIRVNEVQLTFYNYPFVLMYDIQFADSINIPTLLTLAATKAFALGKRAKWKDYVDLYFILQVHSLGDIVKKANDVFKAEFSEKLFREQLSYHNDIDYSEKISFLPGFQVSEDLIKQKLIETSIA